MPWKHRSRLSDRDSPLGLRRVFADVYEPTHASISVLGKLGMRRTGREIVGGRGLLYYEIASAL